ncbi:hypothetical protein QIH07_27060, partial [Klebsiella pneumoniae]|nr:hypothetical protein [Klebsiella pneumoniae]
EEECHNGRNADGCAEAADDAKQSPPLVTVMREFRRLVDDLRIKGMLQGFGNRSLKQGVVGRPSGNWAPDALRSRF